MLLNIVLFVVGLLLILFGANILTEGSSALAKKLGVSPLVVGLTIVAFGTSAPELVVSLSSASKGLSDISLGNVVGSNIFNIFAIIGVVSIIKGISISKSTIYAEIPFMLLSFLLLLLLSFDSIFTGLSGYTDLISRSDGIILLIMFSLFLVYSIYMAKAQTKIEDASIEKDAKKEEKTWLMIVKIIGGLAVLICGGELFVNSASAIARSFNVSEAVIGLTLVAGGTSVPELATSIVAAYKKESDIAIGNVVGSCIFNILLIVGISATVSPISIQSIGIYDYLVMIGGGVLMFVFSRFFGDKIINRIEGILLILSFIAYYVVLLLN